MKVSVIIPSLNRAKYIRDTIDSVLNQDYPYLECIVVDGGSTDGTIDILKSYGDKIKWISEPDRGHADAINKGWKMAQGEILSWLNADDVLKIPDAISTVVNLFRENPDVDVIYGDCGKIDSSGQKIGVTYCWKWNLNYAIENCDHCIPQPSAFIRRRILEKVGYLDINFYQKKDHELWLRIGLYGKIKYFPFLLSYERAIRGMSFDGRTSAPACVQVTRKFFSLKGAEKYWKLKKRAYSNAYLRGIDYAYVGGKHWDIILKYFIMAFVCDPWNHKNLIDRIYRYLPCLKIYRPFYRFFMKNILKKKLRIPERVRVMELKVNIDDLKGEKILILGKDVFSRKLGKKSTVFNFTGGNFFESKFDKYDTIVCYEFLENLGINEKYGFAAEPSYSDLEAMKILRKMLRKGGKMILVLPVGEDASFVPLMRIFGKYRLSMLFKDFKILKEKYFKDGKEVSKEFALTYEASPTDYIEGVFYLA